MSFQTPITIAEAIDNIEANRYLLPAIQREFVWPSEKIEWLFDSLMRGYPISSFLFWNVESGSGPTYKFYRFLRKFRQVYQVHNEEASIDGLKDFTAVLDGQQRLTSLWIGLKGSYAYKEKWRHWSDDERNMPTRQLYLNIKRKLNSDDEEDGREFEFSFLKESDTAKADIHAGEWFRVGKILDLRNIATFNKYVTEQGLESLSIEILARLQEVIFSDRVINYFLEKEQDLHKALNIFIRINSGGQPLDFSDLIMSIAISNWQAKNARDEIHGLVDSVRGIGFSISKDLIFKAYLYLYSKDIRFKVTNFSAENAHNFEKDWEKIRDAILATFELIRDFGYEESSLTSNNVVIPVIYYLYHRDICKDFGTAVRYKADRETIQKWLHVMLLKRVLGTGGADGTLSQIRKAFTDDVSSGEPIKHSIQQFPATEIYGELKRDMSVGDEFVEELLKTQKDDRYAFPILALLYPNLDYRNHDFHKDHLHPISAFSRKAIEKMGLDEATKQRFLSPEWNNSIVNLQMLDSNENKSKQDRSLDDWVTFETQRKDRVAFLDRQLIPADVSLAFADFILFAERRRAILAAKLKEILK
jgi:uncharacterized protein with ParB-like and HNH nuclease domain